MNKSVKNIDELQWIQLPEEVKLSSGDFQLEPSILLPVEKQETDNYEDLSWDKIISAVMLLLANNPSNKNASYYRKLVLTLKPDIIEQLQNKSLICQRDKDFSTAEHIQLAIYGLSPDSLTTQHNMVRFYRKKARFERLSTQPDKADESEKAASLLYKTLASRGSIPNSILFEAGTFFYHIGNYKNALEQLEAFLNTKPQASDYKKAIKLANLCKTDGQASELYMNAYNELNQGHLEKGLISAGKFREIYSEGWPADFLLGWALRLKGDWEEALHSLMEARRKGCEHNEVLNELAICARELKDYAKAERFLHESLSKDSENIKVISNLAIINIEQGKNEDAIRWLKIALTLEPSDAICLRMLKRLED